MLRYEEENPLKGCFWGVTISLLAWGVLIGAILWLVR